MNPDSTVESRAGRPAQALRTEDHSPLFINSHAKSGIESREARWPDDYFL